MTDLDLWEQYVSPIGPKEARTFREATLNPKREFHTRVILPQHYRGDLGLYMGISQSEFVAGRNHYNSMTLVGAHDERWAKQTYFNNPMTIDTPLRLTDPELIRLNKGAEIWDAPKDRVVLGLHQTFTFEFDQDNIPFFKTQMSWLRSPDKKATHSPMGRLFTACSERYIDFKGITVAYGGNKSNHIHIVFDTALAVDMVQGNPRGGLMNHWAELKPLVMEVLQPGCEPDLSMDEPEKFRRLPNGTRVLEKANLLGMPAGSAVPQLALWEMYRDRAHKSAKESFWSPVLFAKAHESARRNYAASPHRTFDFSPWGPSGAYCADKLREIFHGKGQCPSFHALTILGGEPVAYFANHPMDKHPSSIMKAGFRQVKIEGGDPKGLRHWPDPVRLPRALGVMLEIWSAEYERISAPKPKSTTEQAFADAATDKAAATIAISNLLDEVLGVKMGDPVFVEKPVDNGEAMFISAPEGISKSRSLIASTPNIWKRLQASGNPTLIMFAFANYKMAEAKAKEFNNAHTSPRFGEHFRAVVVPSFTELYKRACTALVVKRMDLEMAVTMGFKSLMEAIKSQQPKVIAYMRRFYARLHRTLDGKVPVIFSVHAVAQEWVRTSDTRMMFSPSYWNDDLDKGAKLMIGRKDTHLGLLIHDEIGADDLIVSCPAEQWGWVESMKEADPKAWSGKSSAADRWHAHNDYCLISKPPVPTSCEEAWGLMQVKDWEIVTPAYSGEYGERGDRVNAKTGEVHADIYLAGLGRPWMVSVKDWVRHTAARTIVLTTESVPTAIVRKIGEPWRIIELTTPQIAMDKITVTVNERTNRKNVASLVLERQAAHRKATGRVLEVVSNKVSHIADTITHSSAKGSNGYIGKDVLQTIFFMGVEQFEQLEVLNAWLGRKDMVMSRHVDDFNQTCGRNMGFRHKPGATHELMLMGKLYEYLINAPAIGNARYDIAQAVSRRTKADAAKVAASIGTPLTSKDRLARLRASMRASA